MRDPGSSVPILMDILKTYGLYSGYVVNTHKTQALLFNYTPTQEMIGKYNFNWFSPHIKYLGIFIPKDIPLLHDINYNYINKRMYDDINRWSLLPLDFGSRIRAVKMKTKSAVFISIPPSGDPS